MAFKDVIINALGRLTVHKATESKELRRKNKELNSTIKKQSAEIGRLEEKVAELSDELEVTKENLSVVTGEMEVMRAQILMYAKWETVMAARLDAEAARYSARKVQALEATMPDRNGELDL